MADYDPAWTAESTNISPQADFERLVTAFRLCSRKAEQSARIKLKTIFRNPSGAFDYTFTIEAPEFGYLRPLEFHPEALSDQAKTWGTYLCQCTTASLYRYQSGDAPHEETVRHQVANLWDREGILHSPVSQQVRYGVIAGWHPHDSGSSRAIEQLLTFIKDTYGSYADIRKGVSTLAGVQLTPGSLPHEMMINVSFAFRKRNNSRPPLEEPLTIDPHSIIQSFPLGHRLQDLVERGLLANGTYTRAYLQREFAIQFRRETSPEYNPRNMSSDTVWSKTASVPFSTSQVGLPNADS